MPGKWRTIRVFISSTFRDMHAERDHLVKFVFPELKEKCRRQRMDLIDVDLRWGVSEEDAEGGKALDICLDEIDSCRPYFIGLLGHRYGCVPPGHQHSITAQEIHHGVLHTNVPRQVVDLRLIIDGKFEGTKLRQEQINCLVENYPWQLDGGKYVLRSGVSEGDLEVIRGVFQQFLSYQRDRSSFFFRSEALTRKLAGVSLNDFLDAGEVERQKLADLKREIVAHGLQWFEYDDLESFGSMVGGSLWKRIEKESGEGVVEEDKEWLEVEAEFHELFIKDRTRHFVGRRDLLDRMRSFCEREGEPPVMMVTGDPGIGKSALMARFSEEIAHSHPDWLIISHFVGASPGSTSLRETLLRLCTCLQQAHDSSDDMPETTTGLIHLLPRLLYKVTRDRKVLIVLDALNQFDATDDAHAMLWLPQQLPDNTKFVLSTLQGDAADALLFRRIQPRVLESPGLNREEVEALVSSYLRDIRHEFPNKEIEAAFLRKLSAGSPLYALVALEELRVFGRFAELEDRIDELPETVPALFDQVLSRIETDFSEALVRKCMSYIACGRQGMTAEELQELLAPHALERGTSSLAGRLPDMTWARLYRACGPYLFERSGVIDFFHGQFKEAVANATSGRRMTDAILTRSLPTTLEGAGPKGTREPSTSCLTSSRKRPTGKRLKESSAISSSLRRSACRGWRGSW